MRNYPRKKMSIDNGITWISSVEEVKANISKITSKWNEVCKAMDPETKAMIDYSCKGYIDVPTVFIIDMYLQLAPSDLIIG